MGTVSELDKALKERGFFIIEENDVVDSVIISANFHSMCNAKNILKYTKDDRELQVKQLLKYVSNSQEKRY